MDRKKLYNDSYHVWMSGYMEAVKEFSLKKKYWLTTIEIIE